MNVNEAKNILLLYRPGLAEVEDPQLAEALALAQREPELARWLEGQGARQEALRAKFRQITVPAGLKEQIISEQPARERLLQRHPRLTAAALAVIILLAGLTIFWPPHRPSDDTLEVYRSQMIGIALSGYGMGFLTNSTTEIRSYFAQNQAPADYVLPAALQKAAVVGCAVQGWQQQKVSMLCFRTGRPLPPNQSSDLWLFVVPRASVKDAPEAGQPRFTTVNGLITAVWTQGDKVYLLGTAGSESTIQQFL